MGIGIIKGETPIQHLVVHADLVLRKIPIMTLTNLGNLTAHHNDENQEKMMFMFYTDTEDWGYKYIVITINLN